MKDILLALFQDKTYKVFFIKPTQDVENPINLLTVSQRHNILACKLYSSQTFPKLLYLNCLDVREDGSFTLNREKIITQKILELRENRQKIFTRLDLDYKVALEQKNIKRQEEIIYQSDFLRDLPNNIPFETLPIEEITELNPFWNVLEIIVINGGSGYEETPTVRFPAPKNGIAAKAISVLEKDFVKAIRLVYNGCGYLSIPEVEISTSATGKTARALAVIGNKI
jgi:hypothetical protein